LLSVSVSAEVACLLEVTARKPGNIHRFRDFADTTYLDFLLSASALGSCLEKVQDLGVGRTVLEIIRRTREVVATNTNLGIAMLLAPLAAVPRDQPLADGVAAVLERLSVGDASATYEAIRLAQPSGLGRVAEQDIAADPTISLLEVMALAVDRDSIARQYANGYQDVFHIGVPALRRGLALAWPLEEAIILCHLTLMAQVPDSLIARKRGVEEADEAARLAARVIADNAGPPSTSREYHALDNWLREIGHERNPGTTADLVTASLFTALRDGLISLPLTHPWSLL
jgi:triphosphoribosyl-dephospho-CoA synthase